MYISTMGITNTILVVEITNEDKQVIVKGWPVTCMAVWFCTTVSRSRTSTRWSGTGRKWPTAWTRAWWWSRPTGHKSVAEWDASRPGISLTCWWPTWPGCWPTGTWRSPGRASCVSGRASRTTVWTRPEWTPSGRTSAPGTRTRWTAPVSCCSPPWSGRWLSWTSCRWTCPSARPPTGCCPAQGSAARRTSVVSPAHSRPAFKTINYY